MRILSPEGRREAAQRWYREVGPRAAVARGADLTCASCGFLLLIGGPLGQAFGVCANGYSPADGRVVAMTFGCGAHSETTQSAPVPVAQTVVDEVGYDEFGPEPVEETEPEAEAEPEQPEPVEETEPESEEPEVADVPQDARDTEHATMQEPDAEEDA